MYLSTCASQSPRVSLQRADEAVAARERLEPPARVLGRQLQHGARILVVVGRGVQLVTVKQIRSRLPSPEPAQHVPWVLLVSPILLPDL